VEGGGLEGAPSWKVKGGARRECVTDPHGTVESTGLPAAEPGMDHLMRVEYPH